MVDVGNIPYMDAMAMGLVGFKGRIETTQGMANPSPTKKKEATKTLEFIQIPRPLINF